MKGLSKKEIQIAAWLEFDKRYFFSSADIDRFSKNKTQRYNIIKNLIKKERIVKLNRTKYYLIPIKAKSGSWAEHPFIIADESCNGKDYFIGGWAAANYWKLTDQIPMQIDVYKKKRQGKIKALNSRLVFHRTTQKRIKNAAAKAIEGHVFRIENKKDSEKWMRLRS